MMYNIGSQIYKYTLIKKIGGGNFGEVWLTEDISLKSQCALKLLSQNNISIDERLTEAQIGNKLKHNNVVNIRYADIVQYGDPPSPIVMIAMPYFKNGSVLSQVNSCNFLPTDVGVKCLIDVLRGLEYLHESGYYHCDIKPNNILVGDNNEYILSDYGITCYSPDHSAVSPRQCYLPHISPETVSNGIYDIRTDIYQLGLTAFRLFNGISEISSDFLADQDQFKKDIINGRVVTDSKYQPFVPKKIRRIISKAIAVNPDERYQSALEMRRALEQVSLREYCTSNNNGSIIYCFGNKEFRYDIIPCDEKSFNLIVYQKSTNTGRETKAHKYCQTRIKKSEIKKYIQKITEDLI